MARHVVGAVAHAADAGGEPRGEYVVVLDGAPPPPAGRPTTRLAPHWTSELAAGATRRDAAAAVADRFGVAPNRVKRLLTS